MTLTCMLYIPTVINCTSLTVNQGLPRRMGYCGNHFGAKCNFSCTIGYRLNGSSTVTCVAPGDRPPGSWDSPLPSCDGRLCMIYSLCNQANFFQLILIVQKVKHSGSRRNQGLMLCYFMQYIFLLYFRSYHVPSPTSPFLWLPAELLRDDNGVLQHSLSLFL